MTEWALAVPLAVTLTVAAATDLTVADRSACQDDSQAKCAQYNCECTECHADPPNRPDCTESIGTRHVIAG